MKTALSLVLLCTLAAAAPAWAAGQEPPPEAFGESIDVRVVNVEAVVTDRRGERVQGLTAADFRLLVDGKEVPVEFFTEVAEGLSAPVPGGGQASPPSPAPEREVGRSFLVFLDESFSIAAYRDQVLRRLEAELDLLEPRDRMAIVGFDGKRLETLSGWTGDRGALREAVARAKARPSGGNRILSIRRSIAGDQGLIRQAEGGLGTTATAASSDRAPFLDGRAPFLDEDDDIRMRVYLYPEIERAIAAAAATMRALPAPAGRKVMLLLSGGWPFPEPQSLRNDPLRPFRPVSAGLALPDAEEMFAPLVATANLLGYTLYPVEVHGSDPESYAADASRAVPASTSALLSSNWELGVHSAMEHLAHETGGKALLNSSRLDALARVDTDTRSYYWLGFSPAWRADDRRHEVRVELRRPGLRARSRTGFSDLSQKVEAAMKTEGLLLFGGGAREKRLRVELGTPRRSRFQRMEVPVTLTVPVESLTLLPTGEGHVAEVTLATGALDRYGFRSDLPVVPLRLTVPGEGGAGGFARYTTTLKLRRAEQRLVFAIQDQATGEVSWGEADFQP